MDLLVTSQHCFVIAEAGVNHNGSLERALAMVDAAAEAGADAVKFQTFRAERVISPGTPKAEYQARQTGAGDQLSMVKALELSESDHVRLSARCQERGIEFMSTPFDDWALELLLSLKVRRLKIPSGEITNRPYVLRLACTGLPLIASTGMADLGEVAEAVQWIQSAWARRTDAAADLTLLHCTSNYPTLVVDANLLAIRTLASHFGLRVGYSDHTEGTWAAPIAVALGATVIEKHFTLDRDLPGPDHQASLEPDDLREMVSSIRRIEAALGDGTKAPRPSELPVRALVRRSLVPTRDLPAGHRLAAGDIEALRPGTGIPPKDAERVLGRRLVRAVKCGALIVWDDLE